MQFTVVAVVSLVLCITPGARAESGNPQSGTAQISSQTKPIPPPEDRVDINHASAAELLKVPGMTSTWAARIMRFRPYRTKLDLVDRGVLPSDVYDRIKDYVIAHRDKQ
jgi:DNA uptake protein ComE-like DNA-binding protein